MAKALKTRTLPEGFQQKITTLSQAAKNKPLTQEDLIAIRQKNLQFGQQAVQKAGESAIGFLKENPIFKKTPAPGTEQNGTQTGESVSISDQIRQNLQKRLAGQDVGLDIARQQGLRSQAAFALSAGQEARAGLARAGLGEREAALAPQLQAEAAARLGEQETKFGILRQAGIERAVEQAQAFTTNTLNQLTTLLPYMSDQNAQSMVSGFITQNLDSQGNFDPESVQPSQRESMVKWWMDNRGLSEEEAEQRTDTIIDETYKATLSGLGTQKTSTGEPGLRTVTNIGTAGLSGFTGDVANLVTGRNVDWWNLGTLGAKDWFNDIADLWG